MRKYIFIMGLFWGLVLNIANNVYSESDVLGWGKVTWGMTHSQVSKIYSLSDWHKEYPRCESKQKITIQEREFSVVFRFDKNASSGKLIGVTLTFSAENVSENHLDNIRDSITAKYGNPTLSEKAVGSIIGKKVQTIWVKNSGKIEYETTYFWSTEKKFVLFGTILYLVNSTPTYN